MGRMARLPETPAHLVATPSDPYTRYRHHISVNGNPMYSSAAAMQEDTAKAMRMVDAYRRINPDAEIVVVFEIL